MTPPRLTPAQRKALMWLPKDGSVVRIWIGQDTPSRDDLDWLVAIGLVQMVPFVWPFDPDGYGLTPAGIAARKELEKRGDAS